MIIYLAFVLVGPSPLASGFSPDTAGYLQLSPYRREPMYGVWANGINALFGSWRIVEMLQVGAFVSFSAWVIVELTLISNLGTAFRAALRCYAAGIYATGATQSRRIPDLRRSFLPDDHVDGCNAVGVAKDPQNKSFGGIDADTCWHDSTSNCRIVGRRRAHIRSNMCHGLATKALAAVDLRFWFLPP